MAQGTFVQALRKEAALSGTFMKGRSLMLNGAVLSIEDSASFTSSPSSRSELISLPDLAS